MFYSFEAMVGNMFHLYKKKLSALLCVLLLFSSCGQKRVVHGYLSENPIKVGQRKEVVRIMSGDPTLKDGENWYYVRIITRSDIVGVRKSYSSAVLKVVFVDDIVKEVQKINVPKETALKMTKEKMRNGTHEFLSKLGDTSPDISAQGGEAEKHSG